MSGCVLSGLPIFDERLGGFSTPSLFIYPIIPIQKNQVFVDFYLFQDYNTFLIPPVPNFDPGSRYSINQQK
jgi:hypothetical protein